MLTINFDIIQTLGLATLVFFVGSLVKKRVSLFQKYFIPAPVIGGLIFSFIIFVLDKSNVLKITMNVVLQDFFMNIFFTCTGYVCSFSILKKAGKLGVILAVGTLALMIAQNLVGVSLATIFGLNKLLGVALGSISLTGGLGSAAAFGPDLEALGAVGALPLSIAAATFGLLLGSLVGGPVASQLIKKYNLKSLVSQENSGEAQKAVQKLDQGRILNALLIVFFAAFIGTYILKIINLSGLTFPYYVGCLFGGALIRNLSDLYPTKIKLNMPEINIISNISLNLFLSMALMTLELNALIDLAIPMIVILLIQTIVMVAWAYFITFKTLGKDYEAAVMAAGHCGVGLGQTPNAIANMSAVIEQNGPAPTAWFVLPVVTVLFINIMNPIIITFFMNICSWVLIYFVIADMRSCESASNILSKQNAFEHIKQ